MAWPEVLGRLNDRALFADPGVIYSYSRYSYGLAARVIESATGRPFEDDVRERLLAPLALQNTTFGPRDTPDALEGLPTAHTTVQDLMTFWSAWWDGAIPGSSIEALQAAPRGGPAGSYAAYQRGVWVDRAGGRTRLTLMCGAPGVTGGFQVFPESGSMVAFGSIGSLPLHTVTFVLSRFGEAFGSGDQVFGPGTLSGGIQVDQAPGRCAQEWVTQSRRPDDFGPMAEARDWAGRYLNGEWFFALEERDGLLVSPRGSGLAPFDVHHFEGTTYFASFEIPPRVGFPLELVVDDRGRRYVVVGERAYLHEDDRPNP
jgi:CubicO group peptidase (beta-lactamase class C family)